MEILKLSSKGQIVIPQKMREDLAMEEGVIIGIEKVNDMIVIKKVDDQLVNQIKRSLEDIKHGRIKEWKG
ncbi:MAG: AbrB/MazE/SpoVT family DNA-binding domain-containing protein [archaeon]|nr:AbrB/MazE/SpoVT family DNA-binding domain-containing protein [archaeon]